MFRHLCHGTILIYVSSRSVADTPRQLRHQAEHCRHLADSQDDERMRVILRTMATEFDQQAADLEKVPVGADAD